MIVLTVLLLAGCGDRRAAVQAPPAPSDARTTVAIAVPDTGPVPASTAAPASTAVPASTAMPDTTVVPVDPVTGPSVPVETTNTESVTAPLVSLVGPSTTLVPGDVSTADPLPTQTDAVTSQVTAEAAVRYAYQHWILIDLDKQLRGHLVENGELNADKMDAALQAARGLVSCARLGVDTVQFTDAADALVSFRVLCGSSRSTYFPNQVAGSAVYRDGTWRISSKTLCRLAFSTGMDCAGVNPDNPVQPTAFELTSVPDGYIWDGGSPANVFGANGYGQWSDSVHGSRLSVVSQGLAGVSKLDATDADFVLASPRFATANGMTVAVGDRPGRGEQDGNGATLAYLRADDVIVHMTATDMTVDQLITLAETVTPTTKMPSPVLDSNNQCPNRTVPGEVVVTASTTGSPIAGPGKVGTTPPPPLIC